MTEVLAQTESSGPVGTQIAPEALRTRTLPSTWVSWLIENLDRGCTPVSLAAVMRRKGFDAEFATIAALAMHDLHVLDSTRSDSRCRCLKRPWQRWLRENIARRCLDRTMLAEMQASGFEQALATTLLDVTRAYLNRPHPLIGRVAKSGEYQCSPCRLTIRNQIDIGGHRVCVSSVMNGPNIVVLDDVLTTSECEELIARASKQMRRSGVVDCETGASVVSSIRTSEGTHFERGDGPTVSRIEHRLAQLVSLEVERFEPMQILHYALGGEYKSHQDYFAPDDAGGQVQARQGGNRIATFVLYLDDVAEGGETVFPTIGLTVLPRRGRAVYFEYMNDRLELDPRCLHAGRPVSRGEKWIATKWVRACRYVTSQPRPKG